MFPGSSPITSPGLVRKALLTEVRALPSPGVTQVRQYYDPLPVPAEPPSLAKALELILRPNEGSPTPPDPLPCMPCPLPRWIEPVPLSGSSRLMPPSPLRRRVGIHDFTCEACSAFTPVTACRVARPPKSGLCHKASAQSVAGLKPLVSYQTYPLLSGRDFPPTGDLRPWGALRSPELKTDVEGPSKIHLNASALSLLTPLTLIRNRALMPMSPGRNAGSSQPP